MARLAFWLVLLGCFATGGACTSQEKVLGALAEGCLLNTDCKAPLVCAFRRCHEACETSRDCDEPQRCVASDRPFHVCQLEQERNCSYNSDCPGAQSCGIDLQCRDQCAADRDCLQQQVCFSGTCADTVELREGGLPAPAADSGTETSSGQPCRYTSECEAPLVCKSRLCARECLVAADCRTGYDCVNSRCVAGSDILIGPAGGIVTAFSGRITLVIPEGSLRAPTAFQVFPVEAWPAGALGPVFQIEPTGLAFDLGATLTYRYAAADLGATAPAALRLAIATGSRWSALTSRVDLAGGTVSAQIAHLSIYGVIGPEVNAKRDGGVDASAGPIDASIDGTVMPSCNLHACGGAISDGCCPAGCSATTDADCAGCGNGQLDPGETCDPPSSCPTTCAAVGCQQFSLANAGTCQAACAPLVLQTACANGDGCCPTGCSSVTDSDCQAVCGNGVVEPGELCDGNCPTRCDPVGCQQRALQGSATTCDARCVNAAVQTACVAGDACCPATCNTMTDQDCVARCGNGVVEAGEACDGNCPTSCAAAGCQLRVPSGSAAACDVQCVNGGMQTTCANNDGCCPAGCNANTDADCRPVCGNGVIEPPTETCETGLRGSCPASCAQRACVLPDLVNGGTCAARCVDQGRVQTACIDGDGCCPGACSDATDADCPTKNDLCANATDISAGGDFPFSLLTAAQESVAFCSAATPAAPDVFFRFQVAAPSQVYFDVFDPAGNTVNVALELYLGGCPVAGGQPIACDTVNGARCGTAAGWPRIFGQVDNGTPYVIAARVTNGVRGRYTLRFHRVPVACVGAGALPATVASTTCTQQDLFVPVCGGTSGAQDGTYFLEKCPATGLSVDTCARETLSTNTILQVNEGSIDLVNGRCVLAPSARAIACNDDAPAATPCAVPGIPLPRASNIVNTGRGSRGIITVTVNDFGPPQSQCGPYRLNSAVLP